MAATEFDIQIKHEQSIKVPVPANVADTKRLGEAITAAAEAGYYLADASAMTSGQRDPATVGLVVRFLKWTDRR